MRKLKNHSSLLSKYSLLYEKNPRSRVFAPLAETYRKLGMMDEALNILKNGIKNHPSYTLGYVVLAQCYVDLQKYELAYDAVKPFVNQNLENLSLQKLFAVTCLNLGLLEEALNTYKHLLLLNPKDEDVAEKVKMLEDDLLVDDEIEQEIQSQNTPSSMNEDEWVQVNFSGEEEQEEDTIENWNVDIESPLEKFKSDIRANKISVEEHLLDDEFYHEEFDVQSDEVLAPEDSLEEEPIITHTLVDLYLKQGHTDRAITILENILELHPNDAATELKLKRLKNPEEYAVESAPVKEDNEKKLENILHKYQNLIAKKAQEKLNQI